MELSPVKLNVKLVVFLQTESESRICVKLICLKTQRINEEVRNGRNRWNSVKDVELKEKTQNITFLQGRFGVREVLHQDKGGSVCISLPKLSRSCL